MRSSILRRCLVLFAIGVLGSWGATAAAQTAPEPATPAKEAPRKPSTKKPRSVSGSPLDTFRSTHLWTETAPAKDFVRESRPDLKSLDYTPLTGTDPERPKPRDAANVLALQAELERARGDNEGRGRAIARTPARKAAK